jgi:hypothetical protein
MAATNLNPSALVRPVVEEEPEYAASRRFSVVADRL